MQSSITIRGMRRNSLREFLQDESGMGTVEVILIIVVLIGLVIALLNIKS